VVTFSHNHTDHLNAETLGPLLSANPALVILASRANIVFAAERLSALVARVTRIALDAPIDVSPFRFHAVPAVHDQIEQDADGTGSFSTESARHGQPSRVLRAGERLTAPRKSI
jgi:L-ascorbate metabolism protein UlaG (beta-lactamase superfamily)